MLFECYELAFQTFDLVFLLSNSNCGYKREILVETEKVGKEKEKEKMKKE